MVVPVTDGSQPINITPALDRAIAAEAKLRAITDQLDSNNRRTVEKAVLREILER